MSTATPGKKRLWLRRILVACLALPLLLLLLAVGTPLGLKAALAWGLRQWPLLTVQNVEGSLLGGFTLRDARWVSEYEDIRAEAITLSLSPVCLLRRTVCVERLAITGADWQIRKHRPSPPFDFPGINKLRIEVPVAIDIVDARLDRLTIQQSSGSHFDIRDAVIRAHTDRKILVLSEVRTDLVFSALRLSAQLEGDLDLRGDTSANLKARTRLDFSGDVDTLDIEAEIRGPAWTPSASVKTQGLVAAEAEISASFLAPGWPVQARLKQTAPITFSKKVPVTLDHTLAVITGHITDWHVEGTTTVSGIPGTPSVQAGIITDGNFRGLKQGDVNLTIGEQRADVSGSFTWYPGLTWNTHADFTNLDLATWLEGVTTSLNGKADVSGEWSPHTPFRNTVSAFSTQGRWRNQPVNAQGGFTVTANSLEFEQLEAGIGDNRLSASGGVGERWQLDASVDMPALQQVLPQLSGAVTALVKVKGPRNTPEFSLSARSPMLQFGETRLDAITATLDGNTGKHRLQLNGQWQGYSASALLDGRYDQAQWQGQLQTLDLSREQQTLKLQKPARLGWQKQRQKLEVAALCLGGNNDSLCVDSRWQLAPLGGKVALAMKQFDPLFFAPFLGWMEGSPGRWSGTAEAQFRGTGLPQQTRWTLQADALTLQRIMDKRFTPALSTRRLALTGELKGKQLDAVADIDWAGENPQAGSTGSSHLELAMADIRTPDSFNANIDSAPLPLAWATPWLSGIQLESGRIGGKVTGRIDRGWPYFKGKLAVNDGTLYLDDKRYGFKQINSTLVLDETTAILSGETRDDRDMQWLLDTPLKLHWDQAARHITLQQGCLSASNSTLCAEGQYSFASGFDIKADANGNISPWLAPLMADNALIDGPFTASASLRGGNGDLAGELNLQSTLSTTLDAGSDAPLPKVNASLNAHLGDRRLISRLVMRGENDTNSAVEGRLQMSLDGDKNLDGHVILTDVDLAPLQPLLSEVESMAGKLDGEFLVSGNVKKPVLEGNLQLSEGKLTSARYPFSLSKITANARLTEQRATLEAALESGKQGRGTLTSEADWSQGPLVTRSHLVAKHMPLKQGSDINLRVDTDVTLISQEDRLKLDGLIHVKEGFLRIAKLPENSVNVSRDVVYVDTRQQQARDRIVDADINLAVQLSDLVQLDGLGAQVRMAGIVGIRQAPPNEPTGRGSLSISEGTYTGYGQKLKITKGQILFNGPLESPVLAIRAVREATSAEGGTVVAGINISGTPQEPESTLFSVPAMPEQDILNYIVTGRPPGSAASGDQFAMNQALLSVGLYGSEGFTRDIASKAGIEDFEISTSTDQEDRNSVNLGGYLSPRLYVQYGVGINTPINTLTLRYRLTQSIFLEAISGAESALDVLYSFKVE